MPKNPLGLFCPPCRHWNANIYTFYSKLEILTIFFHHAARVAPTGDCFVYCSYQSVACPPLQNKNGCP